MITILLPANGVAGILLIATVMVLKAHPGAELPPDVPLPVAVVSFPLIGSTYQVLFEVESQVEQVWLTQAVPTAPQSLSTQQLPPTQAPLQQKSPWLAPQLLLLGVQAAVTHLPVVVLQMSLLP
jgi:hypothetical protein